MNTLTQTNNYEILYTDKFIKINNTDFVEYDLYDKDIKIRAKDILILEDFNHYFICLLLKLKSTDSYGVEFINYNRITKIIDDVSIAYDIDDYKIAKVAYIDTINMRLLEYMDDEIQTCDLMKTFFAPYIYNYYVN